MPHQTRQTHQKRFERLPELLDKNGLDACFLAPSSDLKYVTGIDLKPDSRLKGLLLTREGRGFFLCPSLYREDVRAVEALVPVIEWSDATGFQGLFRKGLEELGLRAPMTVAFSRGIEAGDMLDAMEGLGATCVNGFSLLSPLRSVKTAEEQALMRRASAMCDAMMEELSLYLRPGLTEGDIRKFIMIFHESHGGKPRVPCAASGPNSSRPHYSGENDRALEEDDIVMIDSGGWYDGYSHDMTRTFFIGTPTEEQRRVYDIVFRAQDAAEKAAAIGAIPAELDKIARDIIEAEGYGDAFPHRLGHGIGMDGHEAPYISQANETPLVEGNCFSIEPGIYLPGKFGVRIENLLMLTSSGREVLNRFPKELIVVRGA
ncbi:MAG: aminopeptidase P family protein [Fretibacterium sp.]|nr:aminopeptidase P family protein [Fretibacterium sp.]